MRGMFVEGKLLKGDILVFKTNNTPAYPTPFIKIRQEEGFWGEGCPGFGPTQAWLWTRDHTGPRALKQNKWIQTLRQLAEWETELALCLTNPPRPFFYWEPDSTSSAPWLPHEFSGPQMEERSGALQVTVSILCPAKESRFLLCIHAVSEPTMMAVPLQIWQYPAGSLGWSGQGLWS